MSQSNNDSCHCWIPVLATVVILFSIFDAGVSAVLGMVNGELISLQQQVEEGGTRLKVAGFLSSITGGLVNLGSTHEAEQVKELLKDMPDLGFLSIIDWVRSWISILGLVCGVLFAFRVSWAPIAMLIWGGMSLVWTGVGGKSSIAFYQGLSDEASTMNILFLGGLEVFFHVVWPAYLIVRLLLARKVGGYPGW